MYYQVDYHLFLIFEEMNKMILASMSVTHLGSQEFFIAVISQTDNTGGWSF
jgi:hypothetical protein